MSSEIVISKRNEGALILSEDLPFENKIDVATTMAGVLERVVTEQKLFSVIQGNKHVSIDGWTTLGTTCGLHSETISTEPFAIGYEFFEYAFGNKGEMKTQRLLCFKAIVEIRDKAGNLHARSEAIATNDEKGKRDMAPFSLISLAQTRAISKAYRNCLGWVMSLAGFDSTPTEEMEYKQDSDNNPVYEAPKTETKENKEPENATDAQFTKKPKSANFATEQKKEDGIEDITPKQDFDKKVIDNLLDDVKNKKNKEYVIPKNLEDGRIKDILREAMSQLESQSKGAFTKTMTKELTLMHEENRITAEELTLAYKEL
jgi:hypothetical protein